MYRALCKSEQKQTEKYIENSTKEYWIKRKMFFWKHAIEIPSAMVSDSFGLY
jgi:hypothetical protein